jgi:hypothetical protein
MTFDPALASRLHESALETAKASPMLEEVATSGDVWGVVLGAFIEQIKLIPTEMLNGMVALLNIEIADRDD